MKKDNNNSDIFISRKDGNFWLKAEPLNKNINTRANETFASVSADGKNLFFTSDRRGSLGGLDIYVSKKQSVGDWGQAENLGPIINTEFDEESPYLSPDGSALYFSSKGHFNMGSFDIFYSPLNKYGQFEECINIGYPINTTGDDLNYFPLGDGKKGYMALINDEKSFGQKDIYRIEILPYNVPKPISKSKFDKDFIIHLTNSKNGKIISILYDQKTDKFIITNNSGEDYTISFSEPK